MEPTIVTGLPHNSDLVMRETFAPILYVVPCDVSAGGGIKGSLN